MFNKAIVRKENSWFYCAPVPIQRTERWFTSTYLFLERLTKTKAMAG